MNEWETSERDHAHPDSPEARATPAGMRWLYRQISYWTRRSTAKYVDGIDGGIYAVIASYYKTLLIEAYEDRQANA